MTKLLFITFLLLGMMLPMNVSASPARPTVSVTDSAIPPGASVPVNVRLREDSVIGEFQRSVHIFYRDFDNPTVLGLSGTIIQ